MASQRMGEESCCVVLPYSENGDHWSTPFEFHDKIPLKTGYAEKVSSSSHSIARHGSFLASGNLMPSCVNIGACVDRGTMVDTWATVGSCAQIGKNVHLSGGVGIGGVLNHTGGSSDH